METIEIKNGRIYADGFELWAADLMITYSEEVHAFELINKETGQLIDRAQTLAQFINKYNTLR